MSRHNDIHRSYHPSEITVVNETTGKRLNAPVLKYTDTAVTVALAEVKVTLSRTQLDRPYVCRFAGMDLIYNP